MHETCAPVWHMRVECEQRDELAPLISMTSSASASRLAGMVSPSALAVLRLITSSNLKSHAIPYNAMLRLAPSTNADFIELTCVIEGHPVAP